eukprot:scaffold119007_cov75-Phaeocystis_antarctica.AAC.2
MELVLRPTRRKVNSSMTHHSLVDQTGPPRTTKLSQCERKIGRHLRDSSIENWSMHALSSQMIGVRPHGARRSAARSRRPTNATRTRPPRPGRIGLSAARACPLGRARCADARGADLPSAAGRKAAHADSVWQTHTGPWPMTSCRGTESR